MSLLYIVGEDIGLAIIVVQLRVPSTAAFAGVAERRGKKAIRLQRVDHCGRRVGNILAVLILDVVREPPDGDALLLGLGQQIGPEVGLPVLRHAKDDVGAFEGSLQVLDVAGVCLHHLDTLSRQLLRSSRVWIAGQTTDTKPRVLEESAGDSTALVSSGAHYDDQLVSHDGRPKGRTDSRGAKIVRKQGREKAAGMC